MLLLRNWAFGLGLSLTLACSRDDTEQSVPTTIQGCKDYFAASKGYGYISDPDVVNAARASVGGSPDAASTGRRPPTYLERAVAECEAGGDASVVALGSAGAAPASSARPEPGTNCNYALLLTRDASVCIARARGFAEQLGYFAGIVYLPSLRRIVWIVRNTTERTASSTSGLSMTLDATTGNVLDTGAWQEPSE